MPFLDPRQTFTALPNPDGPPPHPNLNLPAPDGFEDEEGFRALVSKISSERQFQGHYYKDKCLRRRIAVRMRARGEEGFAAYAALLDRDPAEYELLLDALTINVTKFFRNYEVWAMVAVELVPRLFERSGLPRRIWSAGCASGEEAYSVSILLHEWAERNGRLDELRDFHILGTDIDRRSLEAARQAEFPELSLAETPDDLRERWFSDGPPFRLRSEACSLTRFARHDLISDEPPREQSLILCRNVIIYFDRAIQEELFLRFYEALEPGGFLVLGKVETLLGRARSLFRPVSGRERIFQRPG